MPGRRSLLPEIARLLPSVFLASIILIASGACTEVGAASPSAPFSFGEDLAPGEGVSCLATADIDGDGIQELIGSEQSVNRIVVWVPDGSGGLRIKSTIDCPLPGELAVADFNGDGLRDIAAISRVGLCASCGIGAASLLIFMGVGDGTFVASQAFPYGDPHTLAYGDFNGDGRTDLVVASGYDTLSVLINGSGGFAPPAAYVLGGDIRVVALGDLDHDGFDDLLLYNGYGATRDGPGNSLLFPGSATGVLGSPVVLPFAMTGYAAIADLDGDGSMDLVLSDYGGGVSVLWNTGSGLSSVPDTLPGHARTSNYDADHFVIADLNADGHKDVISATNNTQSDHVAIQWNMGARRWEQSGLYVQAGWAGTTSLAALDFDLDGLADILKTSVWPGIQGFRHIAPRSFAALEEYAFPGPVHEAFPITLNDGRPAILISTDSTRVMIARPDGSFGPAVAFPEAENASGIDWNQDGLVDLASPRGDSLEIHFGGGGSETVPKLPSGTIIGRGDFNGDGLKDVLLGTPGLDLRIAFRDPLHGYSDPMPFPAGSDFPQTGSIVAIGDFNGDGLCDFAAGQRDSDNANNSVIVYLNSSGGRFVRGPVQAVPALPLESTLASPSQLLAVDLDGDHKLDIVFCGTFWAAGGWVWVGRGIGDGSFEWTPDRYYLYSEDPSCDVIDLTNDGYPDLVGMSPFSGDGIGRFSFRANLGNGRFGEPGLLHDVGAYPGGPTFGDLNGDGRTDVVFTSNGYYPYSTGVVRVLLNIGRDIATPVALSPLRAVLQGTQARIEWFSQDRTSISGTVMRSDNGGGWHGVGTAWGDGSGLIAFTDATVHADSHYSYRLDYTVAGVSQHTATIDLFTPAVTLAVSLRHGNPAHGRLQVSCVLPSAEPARIDLFDIGGRRVYSRTIARWPDSDAAVELNASSRLMAGVYWARLTQGGRSVGTRIVLLP